MNHFSLEDFRFKEDGPWDGILNSIPSEENSVQPSFTKIERRLAETAKGIKSGSGDIKKKVAKNVRKMAEDINCVLGKCKNVEQQERLEEDSEDMENQQNLNKKDLNMNNKKGFEVKIKKIQAQLDDRFVLLRTYDGIISTDNTIRFYVMDNTTKETLIMKLYFKGDPKSGEFYHENTDPNFKGSMEDCKKSKLIGNRVFGKPMSYADSIVEGKDKLKYPNFESTRCIMESGASGAKTAYYSIFTIPQGENLLLKCLHGDNLNSDNSCIQYLKLITGGIINGIKILNSGKQFYKHSNIRPNNIYLQRRNDTEKIILDNMVYDKETYDDPNNKPFKSDLNMLGETLIQMISGNSNPKQVMKEVPNSPFSIYFQVNKYLKNNSIDIELKQKSLGMKQEIENYLGKCVTLAEFEFKLQKSVFNFIYRLKCSGTNPNDSFMDLNQALKHEFMKEALGVNGHKENWDIEPADY
jgi:hypothetical protein